MNRKVEPNAEAVCDALCGVGKNELWEAIETDWNKEV